MLGGRPSYSTLKRYCQAGLIECSRSLGGGHWLLSDQQIGRLRERLEGGGHGEAALASTR